MHARRAHPLFALVVLFGCSYESTDKPKTVAPSSLAAGVQRITIEPAPAQLRGRVALASGARVYARPTYTSPSWSLALPEPPLTSADGPPRARAFRVVGVVRSSRATSMQTVGIERSGDFVAVTNDLDGEEQDPASGCGPRFSDLDHLRMLVYVPAVHIAEVTTRSLELEPFSPSAGTERLRMAAGVRVGAEISSAGLPELAAGSSWRWIDADGIRTLAPIPDDAVGLAWEPEPVAESGDAGEALMRDAEGSTIWLRDPGGDSLELTVRNECAEHRKQVNDPKQVANLRALALDLFYDQRPPNEPIPVVEPEADYRIPAGTPLRWTDGDLAGEVLGDWSVAIGVGQTWDGRRCFPLALGTEFAVVDAPALACVDPDSLVLLRAGAGFGVSDEIALGGSVEIGPFEPLEGGPWDEQALRLIANLQHEGVSECLRPLLLETQGVEAARWDLQLSVSELGRVEEVELEVRGPTHDAVEDCLRAEAFTWLLPEGEAGRLAVPVVLGPWTAEHDPTAAGEATGDPAESQNDAHAEAQAKHEAKAQAKAKQQAEPERGKVLIIRDEEPESSE